MRKDVPVRIYAREHDISNELIEEFMLLANKRVAERVGKSADSKEKRTFVYRIHDKPDNEKLLKFSHFIKRFGYKLSLSSGKQTAKSLNKLLDDVKGTREQDIVENLALRAMARLFIQPAISDITDFRFPITPILPLRSAGIPT